jgi:hypothetical protein
MTNRERDFAKLGWEHAANIEELAQCVIVPTTGREVRRVEGGWEAQPWNDNYWCVFADLLDAATFATPPQRGGPQSPSRFALTKAINCYMPR